MTASAAAIPPPEPHGFGALLRRFPKWLVHRLPSTIAAAIGAGVVGYVVNVWLMAARYDGFNVPPGSAATGQGNFLQGGLFWALLPALIFSLVGYRKAVGGKRFWRDMRGLPRGLLSLVRADGAAARVHLFWGAAAGMGAALLIGPSLGIVLSAGILVAMPTVVGNLLSSSAYRAVNAVIGKVSPTTSLSPDTGMLSTAVSFLGTAASLAAAFVITDTTLKIALALALAAIAFALSIRSRTAPPPAATLLIGLVAAAGMLDSLLRESAAWADDGGYWECGESWSQWLQQCAGSETVRQAAVVGGVTSAAGAVVGSFAGEMAGEAANSGAPGGGDPAMGAWVDDLLSDPAYEDFRSQYPDVPDDGSGFEQYIGWRQQQGLDIPPLPPGWEWGTSETPPGPEAGGVTTAEGVEGPRDLFEGADGWSGGGTTPEGETPEGETPEGETPGEGETPEGETPEGETPEGETPEGETPEGETPEGETPEGETPGEGETPEGETPEGETPGEGETPEGETPEGETPGEGETPEGEEPGEGETPEGETPEGETPEGETPEGETPEGETPEGETPGEGETPEGETPEGEEPGEGETPEGETPEGETPEGETPEGETPEGEEPGADETPEGEEPGADETPEGEEPGADETPEGEEPGEGETTEGEEPGEGETTEGEEPGEGETTEGEEPGEGETPEGEEPTAEEGEIPPPDHEKWRQRPGDVPAVDGDGKPLVDPTTGERLWADPDGNVRYGDEWLSPEDAASRIAKDQQWVAERAQGHELVEQFRDLQDRLSTETDPAVRAELEAQMRQTVLDINENFQAKAELKAEGRGPTAAAYDAALRGEYDKVDADFVDKMNEMGIRRGGNELTVDQTRTGGPAGDITDFRNVTSEGTAGMDRDVGLNEARVRELSDRLAQLEPGSPEARAVAAELRQAQAESRMTIDLNQAKNVLETQLRNAPAGSAEAQRISDQLQRIQTDLDAGKTVVDLSPSRWNEIASVAYEGSYRDVTGGNAERAFQGVTQAANPEAYRDLAVLGNDPANRPFNPDWGGQTGDVTRFKAEHLQHLVHEGVISQATADQEIARGTAKDMNSKLLPELRTDPGVDPAKLERLERIADVLDRAGRGEIPPGQIDQQLRAAAPDIEGLNLDKANRIVASNIEAATKWRGDMPAAGTERVPGAPEGARTPGVDDARTRAPEAGPRGMDTMGRISDAGTVIQYTQQNIARGMDPTEAAAVATAQTAAGNAAMASGVCDPRSSMVGQALLPNELRGALPDQVVENFVGTGYEAGRAGVQAISDSISQGRIDTTAIDNFAESVANRQGTDPMKGYAVASQFLGEEMARTDGGNLASDLQQIYQTGAGSEVLNESMANFADSVERGEHGAPLQGLAHITKIAVELGVDPSTTMGDFIEDCRTIWNNGVGDDYWSEAVDTTTDVIKRTPLLGTVAQGYEEIARGIGERGVTGFASDFVEGGAAFASQSAEALADSASRFGGWVKSWF